MSILIKAAVFGGLAYFITRAARNPAVKEALSGQGSLLSGQGSLKSDLHPDETVWPTQVQQANTGPSS